MATVVNKQTLEVVDFADTPNYDKNMWLINPDLSKVARVPRQYWFVRGNEVHEMSAAAKAAIDESKLPEIKAERLKAFSVRTEEVIAGGFEFPAGSGAKVVLSGDSRIDLMALVASELPASMYPMFIQSHNGIEMRLNSHGDALALHQADMAYRMNAKKHEAQLRVKVNEAKSIAALKAVIDHRSA
jgi:hypothetical protein